VIGVVGVEGVLGGTRQVTAMIEKLMCEEGVPHRVYGVDSLSLIPIHRDLEELDTLLIVGGWYYPLWLMEDFVLDNHEKVRMVGYLVTEGPIPKRIGSHKAVGCDFYNMLTDYSSFPYFYNSVKVFLFPSRSEGFGLPPLEAMSCGVPVVYSDAPAHNEFCVGEAVPTVFMGLKKNWESHVYVCIYESRPEDYVDAVLTLLRDEERLKSLSEEARAEACRYDYRTVYKQLLDEVVA